jgi:hypothetical protein
MPEPVLPAEDFLRSNGLSEDFLLLLDFRRDGVGDCDEWDDVPASRSSNSDTV